MQRWKLTAVLLTAVAGLAGCGLFGGADDGDDLGFDLDEAAIVTVFLRSDVTGPQRTGVQTALRALPDVAEVTYESREQAYAKFKELWAEEDPAFVASVGADSLPESFRAKMTTMAAVTKVDQEALKDLPGVQDVVVPSCTTVAACQELKASASPAGNELDKHATMVVFLDEDVTAGQRANVEAQLKALPDVTSVTFSSAAEAFRELDERGGIAPGTENTLTDSFVVIVSGLAALRAIDDGPAGAGLRDLAGVQRLYFPCRSEPECLKLLGR